MHTDLYHSAFNQGEHSHDRVRISDRSGQTDSKGGWESNDKKLKIKKQVEDNINHSERRVKRETQKNNSKQQ